MKPMPESDRQCAAAVLMIRPARFGANPETAASNRFQQGGAAPDAPLQARREFDGLVARLADAGVAVHVADDSPEPAKPDACFPNNWVSFHDDGSVVLYPMLAASRRLERRAKRSTLLRRAGYRIARTIDLLRLGGARRVSRGHGQPGARSLPSHRLRLPVAAHDAGGARGFRRAPRLPRRRLRCAGPGRPGDLPHERDDGDRRALRRAVRRGDPGSASSARRCCASSSRSGHEPIVISVAEMNGFAGNLLALSAGDGRPLIAMSDAAWNASRRASGARSSATARS